ncbi:MAG TPA: hypothetical protein VGP93_04165, partial [Polyangiaceae bacterium]|nr:hypothetical protein [Polyangiaceae bacterium]
MPAHPLTARVRSSLLARVLVMGMALAAPAHGEGVLPNEATKAMQKAADQKFAEGNKLFKAGKFEEAIVAFQQAHDIVSSPDSTLMIARAQQNQGDLLKAHEAYNTALTEAEAATQVDEKYRPTLQSI